MMREKKKKKKKEGEMRMDGVLIFDIRMNC